MDYEKKYKEALERAKQFSEKPYLEDSKGIVEYIFPELKESEDERIRKCLIDLVSGIDTPRFYGVDRKAAIAWLEKQGEQKPINIVTILDDYFANTPKEQQEKDWEELKHLNNFGWKLVEQNPADKVEPKFKVEDVIRLKGSAAEYTIKKVTDTTYYTNGWSCGIERCEEDYELVEQKPAEWSEEDEWCLEQINFLIRNSYSADDKVERLSNWLKSLKERYTWNPSVEQMVVLNDIIINGHLSNANERILKGLQEQLKKLKE